MRHLYIYAAIFLAAAMCLRAQTTDPLNFSARFDKNAGGEIFLKWDSSPGYRDILESTTDLLTWSPITAPLCGYGQTYSVGIPDAESIPGAGGGQFVPLYAFSQRRYPNGSLTVTWMTNNIQWRLTYPPAHALAQLTWPGALQYHKTDPAPPLTPWRILVFTFSAHAMATPYPDSPSPTPEALAYLDRLLSIQSEIADAIAAGPPVPEPQNIATASEGTRALYRVRREMLDTDDDLINDCQEYTWGFTDENNPDTDGDGTLDTAEDFDADGSTNLTELAFATDPVHSGILHTPATTYYADTIGVFSTRVDFRCWQDIRKPYRYCIEQSANLLDWAEVNPYDRLFPQFTQPGPVPGMEILGVRSDYLANGLPHPYMRVRVSRAFPPHHLKHPAAPVRQQDWRDHNNAHIEAIIPDNEFGRNIFDRYDPTGDCQWARWCWTNQLDFTGVAFSDGYHWPPGMERLNTGGPPMIVRIERTGTTAKVTTAGPHNTAPGRTVTITLASGPSDYASLNGAWSVVSTPTTETITFATTVSSTIPSATATGVVLDPANPTWPYYKWGCEAEAVLVSPIHAVFTGHWRGHLTAQGQVVFHDAQGKRIARNIIGRSPDPNIFPYPDVGVIRLDAPVPPGVKIYKLFAPYTAPGGMADQFIGAKVIAHSREMEAFPYQVGPLQPGQPGYPYIQGMYFQSPAGTSAFYKLPNRGAGLSQAVGGDSGGPVWAFHKGEQVLFGLMGAPGNAALNLSFAALLLNSPEVAGAVQQRMDELGGGYTLQTVTLDP